MVVVMMDDGDDHRALTTGRGFLVLSTHVLFRHPFVKKKSSCSTSLLSCTRYVGSQLKVNSKVMAKSWQSKITHFLYI